MTTASELREAAISVKNSVAHIRAEKCSESVEPLRELLAQQHELAAALCLERAEQMERGEQGFEEWWAAPNSSVAFQLLSHIKMSDAEGGRLVFELAHTAWHAAQAQMQAGVDELETHCSKWIYEANKRGNERDTAIAKLDAANKEIAAFKQAAQRDGQHFMPTTLKMSISDETREVCHLHDDLVCDLFVIRMEHYIEQLRTDLDAAQKRVAELEGWRGRASGIEKQVAYSHYKVFGDRNYAYSGPHEAIDLLAAECITCAKERNKARDALATAERERELLRVEVRRCHHIANKVRTHTAEVAHSISEKILTDCSPEVRALVDHADPSNATG